MGEIERQSISKVVVHGKTDLEIFSRVKIHWLEIISLTDIELVVSYFKEFLPVNKLLFGNKYRQ